MGIVCSKDFYEQLDSQLLDIKSTFDNAQKCTACVHPKHSDLAEVNQLLFSDARDDKLVRNQRANNLRKLLADCSPLAEFLRQVDTHLSQVKSSISTATNLRVSNEEQARNNFTEVIIGADTVAALAFSTEQQGMIVASNDGNHLLRKFVHQVGATISAVAENLCNCDAFVHDGVKQQHFRKTWTLKPFCTILFWTIPDPGSFPKLAVGPFQAQVSPPTIEYSVCHKHDSNERRADPESLSLQLAPQLLSTTGRIKQDYEQLRNKARNAGFDDSVLVDGEGIQVPFLIPLLPDIEGVNFQNFGNLNDQVTSAPMTCFYDGLYWSVNSLVLVLGAVVTGIPVQSNEEVINTCKILCDSTIIAKLLNLANSPKSRMFQKKLLSSLGRKKLFETIQSCIAIKVSSTKDFRVVQIYFTAPDYVRVPDASSRNEIAKVAEQFCSAFNNLVLYLCKTNSSQSLLKKWFERPKEHRIVNIVDGCAGTHAEMRILHALIRDKWNLHSTHIAISKHVCELCLAVLSGSGLASFRLPDQGMLNKCISFGTWPVPCFLIRDVNLLKSFLGNTAIDCFRKLHHQLQVKSGDDQTSATAKEVDGCLLALLCLCQPEKSRQCLTTILQPDETGLSLG